MIDLLKPATSGIMIQFLDLPEEIFLELIIRFLSISECVNLVGVIKIRWWCWFVNRVR
jgi:hypothetical protein